MEMDEVVRRSKDMQFSEFIVDGEFWCGGKRWRCTDIGRRVIVAIPLEHDDDSSWYNGPPYAVAECVFDENDMPGCTTVEAGTPACSPW
jgi:hypothetical protein